MSKTYDFKLKTTQLEFFKHLKLEYSKYGKLYVVSIMYDDYIALMGPARNFQHTLFGVGQTIDTAEIDLLNTRSSLDKNSYLMKLLQNLERDDIFKFSINIESYDEENDDFHMSLSTSKRKVHISGNDFETNINNLYQKYIILE